MTNFTIGRWLLVAVAVLGLALAVPVVSAHSDGATSGPTTAPQAPPANATAAQWTDWMEANMNDHMGPGSVEWMESHMGISIEQMGQYMADNDAPYRHGDAPNGGYGMDGASGYGMGAPGGYGMGVPGGYGMDGNGGYGIGGHSGYGMGGPGGYGMGGYGMGC